MEIKRVLVIAWLLLLSCDLPEDRQSGWQRLMDQGDSLFAVGNFAEAAVFFDSASHVIQLDSLPIHRVMAVSSSALCYSRIDELIKADSLFSLATKNPEDWQGQDTLLMNVYLEYGEVKAKLGELRASLDQLTQARVLSDQIPVLNDSVRFAVSFRECVALQQIGRFSEAKDLCQRLYANAVRDYGTANEKSLLALEAYFTCVLALREFEEAEGLIGAAIVRLADDKLEDSQFLPRYGEMLALAKYRQGKISEALKSYRVALRQSKHILGAEDRITLSLRSNYVNVLREAGYSFLADSVESLLIPK